MLRLEFSLVQDWPTLAWLARVPKSDSCVTVYHGDGMELGDEWFHEAVWDGNFEEAAFDRTDLVAGSGGRLRGEKIIFVSAGSTVDRLNSLEVGDEIWVSNSTACLLAALDATLDPSYPGYFNDLRSIVDGLNSYQRFLNTSIGPIQLTYFNNLVWDGNALVVEPKPGAARDFTSFFQYHSFLDNSLQRLAANMKSTARKRPYDFIGTLSSGYDSTTITVLAKKHGCKEVICIDQARGGDEDSGQALAKLLGVNHRSVGRENWRESAALPEAPFIAGDGKGEDVFFKGAESLLANRVLLTGFHGDKIWSKAPGDLSAEIVRGDQSGLDLTEYRLRVGFIHCPITFWGVRQISDINLISNSAEMRPWDVPGDYSRPICRRIAEEAGVPREMFGIKKRAASVMFHTSAHFLSPQSAADYLGWLKRNRGEWLRRGRVPPLRNLKVDYWTQITREHLASKLRGKPIVWRMGSFTSDSPSRLRRYVFPWAVEHFKKYYRSNMSLRKI